MSLRDDFRKTAQTIHDAGEMLRADLRTLPTRSETHSRTRAIVGLMVSLFVVALVFAAIISH